MNYSTGTLTIGNERQVCNFHPSLDQRAPNNPIKNQKDKKTSSISTSSPLFLRLPLREKKTKSPTNSTTSSFNYNHTNKNNWLRENVAPLSLVVATKWQRMLLLSSYLFHQFKAIKTNRHYSMVEVGSTGHKFHQLLQ
ncbi:TPA: hypothetical protein RQO70_005264 [Klebsiella michiganensis]|nr:hypothetical protein [Klebsiella michiganensis]HDX9093492.1 hypothetical protein [Klebsiella michiganensis]